MRPCDLDAFVLAEIGAFSIAVVGLELDDLGLGIGGDESFELVGRAMGGKADVLCERLLELRFEVLCAGGIEPLLEGSCAMGQSYSAASSKNSSYQRMNR